MIRCRWKCFAYSGHALTNDHVVLWRAICSSLVLAVTQINALPSSPSDQQANEWIGAIYCPRKEQIDLSTVLYRMALPFLCEKIPTNQPLKLLFHHDSIRNRIGHVLNNNQLKSRSLTRTHTHVQTHSIHISPLNTAIPQSAHIYMQNTYNSNDKVQLRWSIRYNHTGSSTLELYQYMRNNVYLVGFFAL